MNIILNLIADHPYWAAVVAGFGLYGLHLIFSILGMLAVKGWEFLDDKETKLENPYLNFLSHRIYGKDYSTMNSIKRGSIFLHDAHAWLMASPLIISIGLTFANISLLAIVALSVLFTARSGRRVQKRIVSHMSDETIHTKVKKVKKGES